MEKVSSLWYRILDENPLPLLHSKARKRRLLFYQSLHLCLLNKLKVWEPKMWGLWSESFPLLHSCKFETSRASLEFTVLEMMNAGILSFSFKNNKLFHRIIRFHLRRLRSYFSNYASKLHWFHGFRVDCRWIICSGLMAWLCSDNWSLGKGKSSLLLTTLLAGPSWSQLEPGLTI